MKKARQKTLGCILAVGAVLLVLGAQQVSAGPLPGAIFTTLEDGSRVNANIYEAMEDVYLDGGPPQNAPSGAAGLPEGDYYFQVTDPSGKVLLSLDPVECRRFHVNADGVIDYVCPATCMDKIKGQMVEVDCTHATGIDIDHQELGAITVQLMPYKATPNKGGVYKVWATPVDMFVGDPDMGTYMVQTILTGANSGMAALFSGLAQAAFDEALTYAKERIQGGMPIIKHQNVKLKLFKMFYDDTTLTGAEVENYLKRMPKN